MNPRWSGDGRTIYYWERTGASPTGRATAPVAGAPTTGSIMIAAAVQADTAITVSSRRRLFSLPATRPDYAVSPTREAFIVVAPAPAKR
jgi:hypothetical protein